MSSGNAVTLHIHLYCIIYGACVKENNKIVHTHNPITVYNDAFLSLSISLRWYLTQRKTLEINPRHPLVKELQRRVEKDESDETSC